MVQSDQEKFAGNYRQLFDTIERGVEQCSTDRLQTLLEEKKNQLKLGLEAFSEPSTQARSKLNTGSSITVDGKTIKLDQNEKDLIIKLSDILNLNELQCASLWDIYRQANKNTLSQLNNDNNEQQKVELRENIQLIMNVINFYFEERIALLECIGSLQRISLDNDHPYSFIANDAIKKLQDVDNTRPFAERLFSQYSKLVRKNIFSKTQFFSGWALILSKQILKEQKSLLDIIFLFSLTESFSTEFILSIIKEFEADSFGQLQAFGYVLDEEGVMLRERVSSICILLSANIIVPSTLNIDVHLNPSATEQSLINSPNIIAKINQVAAYLGDRQEHSVFLLAWSFFLTCIDSAINNEQTPPTNYVEIVNLLEGKQNISTDILIDRPIVNGAAFDVSTQRTISIKQAPQLDRILLGRSLKLNVFNVISSILESDVCSEEDVNCLGYRSVLCTLLKSFLSVTRPYFIPPESYSSLINAYCLLYQNQPELCTMFWTKDFNRKNPSSLLATARGRFPVFFTDFTRLLASLAGVPNEDASMNNGISATSVYEYLCEIPSITVVLGSSIDVTACEENGEVVTYANQPIRVTHQLDSVSSVVIPQGTRGLFLNTSDDQHVIQYDYHYSGWHMLISVLASFITANLNSTIDIQDDENNIQGKNLEAINSILELIYSVLSSNPKLATTLVDHIEMTARTADDSTGMPILISILCQTLNYCSTIKPYPIPILTLVLRCLTLLLPHYRNHIWSYLKIAPILPTTNTSFIKFVSSSYKSSTSAQILEIVSKVECNAGRYPVLLAFLDLVQALVRDIQRDWWIQENNEDVSLLNRQYQVEVLYVCLYYIMSDVFPSYSHWRYKKLSERFLIGIKILSILIEIVRDFKEPVTSNMKLSLNSIREGVFNNFLYEGGVYHISPLVNIISDGAVTANTLYKANHPKEAQRIEKLTELTLIFVKILLQHRLQQIKSGTVVTESILERLLLERSTGGNSSDFLLRVARHIQYHHTISLPIQATYVLSLLCRTISTWKNVPNFVQYFGGTDQVHAIIRTYLEKAKDANQNEVLLTSIWQLITVLLETQPSLAILFLDCGDFIMPSPKSAVRLLSNENKSNSSAISTNSVDSAIRAAVDILGQWETLLIEKPTVMSNVLRFLATFWKTAFDHYALVERTRVDSAIWDIFDKVLFNPSCETDITADHIQSLDIITGTDVDKHLDTHVRRLCCLNLSKAFIMRIIAYEVHLTASNTLKDSSDVSQKLPAGLKNLIIKISETNKLLSLRDSFVKNDFNPATIRAAEASAEMLLQTIGVDHPENILVKMARIGFADDDAAGEARQYGDSYLYDYHLASTRVYSLYKDIESKHEDVNYNSVVLTPDVQAVLELKQFANQFLQNTLLANHNSSIVDSQIILLRSFKSFIETCSRRVNDLIWTQKDTRNSNLFNFIKRLIGSAQQETRDDGVTLTSYSILIQFIRNLIEDWINANSGVVTGNDTNARKEYKNKTYELLSALCSLLDRENYALFNSICDTTAIRFHRPLLESIMLCLRTLNGTIEDLSPFSSSGLEFESCLSSLLTVVCSSFHVLVIKAGSYSAATSLVSEEVLESCIKDVTIVISLIEEMISPKYKFSPDIWLEIFEKSNTIPSLLSLFYNGVEIVVKEINSQISHLNGISSISITPYAESALYLLLALSNIPKAAEKLVKHSIFDSLCNNLLSTQLQQGALDLFIRFGDSNKNGPNYVERNPLHLIWCQILAVVNNIIRTIGNSEIVLQNTINFIQMYGPQISRAFKNAEGANDSIFGLSATESLASPLLEEIERITMIFFGLAKYLERLPNTATGLFWAFKECSLTTLQRFLYFFTHPSHMQAQLYPVDNIERQQAHTFVSPESEDTTPSLLTTSDNKSESKLRISQLMQKIIKSTMIIIHYMLSTLIVITHTDVVLTSNVTEWPFGNAFLYPDMRMTVSTKASLGTLTECMNVCIMMIGQWQDIKDYPIQELLDVVQDCALLLTTQIALWVTKPDLSAETRVEIAQENILDITESINKIGTSLSKLQEDKKLKNIKPKLKLIHMLQNFLGDRYFEKS
ncbi:nucleoporin subcomplex protein binding to Pom34-domain-containing protein [Cokeromyces recurvatus]|uniref:nucleoporin subcomplex protein binding to Pom34-domain-containing protein n=1 Tax=Cokeromyces recurvatus TaxID=90255 RepID=UPI00222093BF|nr:nucleoporin subcomplex protein binding to Pom34-domain-containing protein [Cokeromyces recurvatus]KAI7903512.1 nucleoporin subcomplex protein binding to Pom34-domain-containing protein [Cokeromyces recurvatus]